jgi:hypothetical protein
MDTHPLAEDYSCFARKASVRRALTAGAGNEDSGFWSPVVLIELRRTCRIVRNWSRYRAQASQIQKCSWRLNRVAHGSGRSIASDAKWATSLHGGVILASNVVIMQY